MKLSTEDATQFFQLMWGLQFFVSQQRQLLPDVHSLDEYVVLSIDRKATVRDALWDNPDLIDSYIAKNPNELSAEELSIIREWKRFVAGQFTLFRYLKEYTVLIRGSDVYGVLGLHDSLRDVFSGYPPPILLDTVLLPYKGRIIYDGMCRTYNIFLGPGIRADLKEVYQAAKQNGRIVTSMQTDDITAKPSRQRPGLNSSSKAAVAEIVKLSEPLRGGTVIQSEALRLLRASARVAQSAAQQPDDLDELVRLRRQVQTALSRLQKALERAEQ
jgi:hypothetical protein